MLAAQPYHPGVYPPNDQFAQFGDDLLGHSLKAHTRAVLERKRQNFEPFHLGRLQDAGLMPLNRAPTQMPQSNPDPEMQAVQAFDAPVQAVQGVVMGRPVADMGYFDDQTGYHSAEGYHSAVEGPELYHLGSSGESSIEYPRKLQAMKTKSLHSNDMMRPSGSSSSVAPPTASIMSGLQRLGSNTHSLVAHSVHATANVAGAAASVASMANSATSIAGNGLNAVAQPAAAAARAIGDIAQAVGMHDHESESDEPQERRRARRDRPRPAALTDRERLLAIEDGRVEDEAGAPERDTGTLRRFLTRGTRSTRHPDMVHGTPNPMRAEASHRGPGSFMQGNRYR
jgi:hypothetical protein